MPTQTRHDGSLHPLSHAVDSQLHLSSLARGSREPFTSSRWTSRQADARREHEAPSLHGRLQGSTRWVEYLDPSALDDPGLLETRRDIGQADGAKAAGS